MIRAVTNDLRIDIDIVEDNVSRFRHIDRGAPRIIPHFGDGRLNQARYEAFLPRFIGFFSVPAGHCHLNRCFRQSPPLGVVMVVLWLSVPTEPGGAYCKPGS